jgi:hypothetical protein
MSQDPWFRLRESGLGWTPVSWRDWLVIAVGALAVVAANLVLLARLGVFHPGGGHP